MAPVSNTSPRLKCLLVRTAAAGLAWAALVSAVASEDRALTNNASVANAGVGKLDAVQVMRQVKTVFVIPLENHDLTQPDPMGEAGRFWAMRPRPTSTAFSRPATRTRRRSHTPRGTITSARASIPPNRITSGLRPERRLGFTSTLIRAWIRETCSPASTSPGR